MIVGFTGFAGSGKDTAAEVLVAHGWVKSAFAEPMRSIMEKLNPIVGFGEDRHDGYFDWSIRYNEAIEKVGYNQAKVTYPELRKLLQRLGTEAGRDLFGKDYWVDLWAKQNEVALATGNVVVTDVRFPNEAERVKDMGGIVIGVRRPGVGAVNPHASEAFIDPIIESFADLVLQNDSTPEAMHNTVLDFLDHHKESAR